MSNVSERGDPRERDCDKVNYVCGVEVVDRVGFAAVLAKS